ncbi:MAG: transposase [Haloplanus sp.]
MAASDDTREFAPPDFDLNWRYTVHIDDSYRFRLKTRLSYYDDPTVNTLVGDLSVPTDLPDSRVEWHRNYTPLQRWVRAHILREARGWNIEQLQTHLEDHPEYAMELGFIERDDDSRQATPDPPGYTQLRDMWEEEFSPRMQGAIQVIAERLVELARDEGIPAPDDVFTPDETEDVDPDEVDEDDPTVRELTTEKSVDIWEHAKPFVTKHWYLDRRHNWQVPENTFFDAQSQMAVGEDLFPETGVGNLKVKGSHDRVHYPSTHRRELKKFSIDDIREMHHKVAKELVERARKDGELVGKIGVAVDITKGHPWTGEIERDEEGNNVEPWILGYMNDNDQRPQHYFQWATIQVVGLDIPLVLDAMPVHRGLNRGVIVDELLENALKIIDDIELLYMDAGFASEDVKEACEGHGVWYLNSGVLNEDNDNNPAEMREEGETVRVIEQQTVDKDTPSRKTIYLPSYHSSSSDDDEADEDADSDDEAADDDGDEESDRRGRDLRQEMLEEFGLEEDDLDGEDDGEGLRPMAGLLQDIHEQEGTQADEPDDDQDDGDEDDDEDPSPTIVKFETNHPDITVSDDDDGRISGVEKIHLLTRHIRRYKNRWGIENGYKKIKRFLPRSGSPDPVLRFFNFTFACVLYNCWRIVDLLVKLEIEDDPDYTPLVTAGRFREIAEQFYGLEKPPPDEWPV